MRTRSRNDRGSLMLGFLPLVILLGTMCTIVTMRSLDSYRASGILEIRLQARAAAEGAVVALLAVKSADVEDFSLGRCRVSFEDSGDALVRPFTVSVLGDEGSLLAAFHYTAWFEALDGRSPRFLRLEKTP